MKKLTVKDSSLFFEKKTSYPLFHLLYLHRDLTITVNELCEHLGLSLGSFNGFPEFKSNVLDPSYQEIHDKTGLSCDYEGFNNGSVVRFRHINLRAVS